MELAEVTVPCHACGYDLRGAPAQPDGAIRCAECGQDAATSAGRWNEETGRRGAAARLRVAARHYVVASAIMGLFVLAIFGYALVPYGVIPYEVEDAVLPWVIFIVLFAGGFYWLRSGWTLRQRRTGEPSLLAWAAVGCIAIALAIGTITFLATMLDHDNLLRHLPEELMVSIMLAMIAFAVAGVCLVVWRLSTAARAFPEMPLRTPLGIGAIWLSVAGAAWVLPFTVIILGLAFGDFLSYGPPQWAGWLMGIGGLALLCGLLAMLVVMICLLIWARRRVHQADAAASAFATFTPATG